MLDSEIIAVPIVPKIVCKVAITMIIRMRNTIVHLLVFKTNGYSLINDSAFSQSSAVFGNRLAMFKSKMTLATYNYER